MLGTVVLLYFVAAVVLTVDWVPEKGFEVKFNVPYTEGFIKLPQSASAACDAGWQKVEAPPGPYYDYTYLYCPMKYNYLLCVYYERVIGYPVGLQIAFDPKKITQILDWHISGFGEWIIVEDGVPKTYYATQQYYTTPEILSKNLECRSQNIDKSTLLQEDTIYVKGFNGDIYPISTTVTDKRNSEFIYQPCIPGMGDHYYYNFTPSLECSSDKILTWFLLSVKGKVVGCGFLWGGHDQRDFGLLEYANKEQFKMSIPGAPECLADYAAQGNYISLHIYYVNDAFNIPCPT